VNADEDYMSDDAGDTSYTSRKQSANTNRVPRSRPTEGAMENPVFTPHRVVFSPEER